MTRTRSARAIGMTLATLTVLGSSAGRGEDSDDGKNSDDRDCPAGQGH